MDQSITFTAAAGQIQQMPNDNMKRSKMHREYILLIMGKLVQLKVLQLINTK